MMIKNTLGKLPALLLLLILVGSCGNFENIEMGKPDEVKVKGFEDKYLLINVRVPVNNPTIHRIKITDMDLKVYLNGNYLGKLVVDEKIVIKGKERKVYQLPVKVRLNNILGATFTIMNLKKGQQVDVRFEGVVTAKSYMIKKKIELDESRKIVI